MTTVSCLLNRAAEGRESRHQRKTIPTLIPYPFFLITETECTDADCMFQPDPNLSPNNNVESRCSSESGRRPCYVPCLRCPVPWVTGPTRPSSPATPARCQQWLAVADRDRSRWGCRTGLSQQRQPGMAAPQCRRAAAGHLSRSAGGAEIRPHPRESASSSGFRRSRQPVDPAGDRIPEHRGLGVRAPSSTSASWS